MAAAAAASSQRSPLEEKMAARAQLFRLKRQGVDLNTLVAEEKKRRQQEVAELAQKIILDLQEKQKLLKALSESILKKVKGCVDAEEPLKVAASINAFMERLQQERDVLIKEGMVSTQCKEQLLSQNATLMVSLSQLQEVLKQPPEPGHSAKKMQECGELIVAAIITKKKE